jgi:hypothetical protein
MKEIIVYFAISAFLIIKTSLKKYNLIGGERRNLMSLQIFTDNKKPHTLIKLIGDTDQQIIDYVKNLKECGYEIMDFPPIERFRRQSSVNLFVIEPAASE